MKKFVLIYYGFEPPTQAIREAWGRWFASLGDRVIDSGSPFGAGREISHAGTRQLPMDNESLTGYTIINAESLDEAEEIARGCPIISGVRVYEAMAM